MECNSGTSDASRQVTAGSSPLPSATQTSYVPVSRERTPTHYRTKPRQINLCSMFFPQYLISLSPSAICEYPHAARINHSLVYTPLNPYRNSVCHSRTGGACCRAGNPDYLPHFHEGAMVLKRGPSARGWSQLVRCGRAAASSLATRMDCEVVLCQRDGCFQCCGSMVPHPRRGPVREPLYKLFQHHLPQHLVHCGGAPWLKPPCRCVTQLLGISERTVHVPQAGVTEPPTMVLRRHLISLSLSYTHTILSL